LNDDHWKDLAKLATRHARWYLRDLPPRSGWSIRALGGDNERRDLEGRSADLAVVLAMASYVGEVPLPHDVAFCAEIGANGLLKPVDLTSKLECLARECPGIVRIVVSPNQDVPTTTLEIFRVATVGEAIVLAFAETSLLSYVSAEVVAGMARDLRVGDTARIPYGAHEGRLRALRDALDGTSHLSSRDVAELRFGIAVAGRHLDRCFPFPKASELEELTGNSQSAADRIASNRLQHAADFGVSGNSCADDDADRVAFLEELLAESARLLAKRRLTDEEAKRLGAFARIQATVGDFDSAGQAAWKAVHYWSDRDPATGEITRPLSELFRLASFSEVSRDARIYLESAAADRIAQTSSFVALSAFRWAVLRGDATLDELDARWQMERLWNDCIAHVRGSYLRWVLWHPEARHDAALRALQCLWGVKRPPRILRTWQRSIGRCAKRTTRPHWTPPNHWILWGRVAEIWPLCVRMLGFRQRCLQRPQRLTTHSGGSRGRPWRIRTEVSS
jgi:hypothetical protein